MHISTENSSQISTESQTDICLQQTDTCVQQTDNFMQQADSFQDLNRCVWQQPQWSTYLPPTPGSYVWSPNSPPPTPFNYGMKPMVASAPVTPDVIPYHGNCIFESEYCYLFSIYIEATQMLMPTHQTTNCSVCGKKH